MVSSKLLDILGAFPSFKKLVKLSQAHKFLWTTFNLMNFTYFRKSINIVINALFNRVLAPIEEFCSLLIALCYKLFENTSELLTHFYKTNEIYELQENDMLQVRLYFIPKLSILN